MRVFVAGATGAIGARLVPQLVERGHEVVGTSRTPERAARLTRQGAEPVVLDLLDQVAVRAAVLAARPDAIVHQATALGGGLDTRHFDRGFAPTNRLRTEGRSGAIVKTEDDPLDPYPLPGMRETLDAIRHLEDRVVGAGGLALRYGGFYGSADDVQLEPVRKRKFPVVGDGEGVWSFVHLDDAAAATVLALERGVPGVYNVVDDDPAPVREWLPALAEAIGAKPPRHVPAWLARTLAGDVGVALMTQVRGASNGKAKRELGWTLRYPSWRQGFPAAYRSLRAAA